jgi:hypothetical protein
MQGTASDITRAVLHERDGDSVVLSIPGTEYLIRLACTGDTAAREGKRVQGVVQAKALRMHKASAGGTFIEPIHGQPRIVQGRVLAVDLQRNRLLCMAATPMWIEPFGGQSAADFSTGDLVNFYVQSGASFAPIA